MSSLRTLSRIAEGIILPYQDYMVVTTLAMKKFRREGERAELLTRFEFITSRFQIPLVVCCVDRAKEMVIDWCVNTTAFTA